MPGDTMRIGDVTLTTVKDIPAMRGEPRIMYPSVDPPLFLEQKEWLNERGHVDITIGSVLVRSSGRIVLVDTGIGREARGGGIRTEKADLLGNLAALGVRPEDVDLVVNTHLHVDHVGWHTVKKDDRWTPTFPNARYLIQQKEWEHFTTGERGERDYVLQNLLPLVEAGVIDFMTHEKPITPEVTFFPTPGHTPDHCSLLVQSQGERALILGDVMNHPMMVPHPEWESGTDEDKQKGVETRRAVLDTLEKEGMVVLAGHFPFPCMGRVLRINDRRVFQAATVE